MCGGGGGDGGAGEIRRQEAERNYKTGDATRRINAVFGMNDPALYDYKSFGSGYQLADDPALEATAGQNKAARKEMYGTTANDIVNYLKTQLTDQHTGAQQQAKAKLARQGLSGGQADINLQADILKAFNRGTLDIKNRADSSVADLKGADETARLNLINQIQAGMDSNTALSSATNALKNNIGTTKSAAMTQSLDNLFSQIGNLYSAQQYVNGANRAFLPAKNDGAVFTNPGSYSGTVYK